MVHKQLLIGSSFLWFKFSPTIFMPQIIPQMIPSLRITTDAAFSNNYYGNCRPFSVMQVYFFPIEILPEWLNIYVFVISLIILAYLKRESFSETLFKLFQHYLTLSHLLTYTTSFSFWIISEVFASNLVFTGKINWVWKSNRQTVLSGRLVSMLRSEISWIVRTCYSGFVWTLCLRPVYT